MADDASTLGVADLDNQIYDVPKVDGPEDESADDALFETLSAWCKESSRGHFVNWADMARTCYDFVAGHQYTQDDEAALRDALRPIVTFNRIAPMVKIVTGLESSNRQEAAFLPRKIGDAAADEILTGAAKWEREKCDAEDEESDAFWDLIVTGMGWTDTILKYDEDPDGAINILRIDPLEMRWDMSAKRRNLSDARFLFRVRDVPLAEAMEMLPDADPEDLNAAWAEDTAGTNITPHDRQQAPFYRKDQSGKIDFEARTVRMVEAQWQEREVTWRLIDPMTGKETTLDNKTYMALSGRLRPFGVNLQAVRQRTRANWRAIIGSKILSKWRGPEQGGYTWKCMTGDRDRNKASWLGLVQLMLDPQRWANKWLSQSMHILNTGAKGGIIAERAAFEDAQTAENDWADPSAIVWVNDGAVAGNKIMPRPTDPVPTDLSNLLQFAVSSIRDCSGVNLELLGMVEREQPGVLEHMRKQAGMTVLASFFDSLRRYRKNQGALMVYFMTNFLSDGRLIKIVGDDGARYVPLIHDPDIAMYDVEVDDTPTSPNIKERVWATLMELMPMLRGMAVPPQIYAELIKYSPLPETIIQKISSVIAQDAAQPKPPPPEQVVAQSMAQLNQAKAQNLQAETQLTGAKLQVEQVNAQAAQQSAQQTAQAENNRTQANVIQAMLDQQLARAKIESLRAAAVANLAKAGIAQQGQNTDDYMAVLDMMDKLLTPKPEPLNESGKDLK